MKRTLYLATEFILIGEIRALGLTVLPLRGMLSLEKKRKKKTKAHIRGRALPHSKVVCWDWRDSCFPSHVTTYASIMLLPKYPELLLGSIHSVQTNQHPENLVCATRNVNLGEGSNLHPLRCSKASREAASSDTARLHGVSWRAGTCWQWGTT